MEQLIFENSLSATFLEVATYYTHGLCGANLLELLARSFLITRQMMDDAGCAASPFRDEMRAALPCRLENHGLRILGIERAIQQYRPGINYGDSQVKAAIAASQTDHSPIWYR
jgi:hypothetical protein